MSFSLATLAQAETFELNYGGDSYKFDMFETNETSEQFYLNAVFGSSFSVNWHDTGIKDALTVFAHRSTLTGLASLGFIFDSYYDQSAGQFSGTLFAPGSSLILSDDYGEAVPVIPGSGIYDLGFAWNEEQVDGILIEMLSPETLPFVLSSTYKDNVNNLVIASPDANNGLLTPVAYDGSDIVISTVSAVPEPSTYALMLGGLGLVGFMAARRRV
ncbi:MAG: PEP-CTERM sorting domain-containing protein [Pseudomonadota bacterium]|nr:PEP-CTERM sorting domain-containing protein [Pseudomonadota bacterium]